MRAIDLFAGCGGLSLGLTLAGIEVVAAIERDPDACASYRLNLGDHMIEASIEDVGAADLPDCDLIAGGPPCQGFSNAGKRDKDDPRNRLWREFFRIVEAKRPRWLLIENVRGMLTMGEDKAVVLAFRAIGYHVSPYLLNAADYGVPQRRLRVFYVGNRIGVANPCPTPTHAQPPRHVMLGLQPWVTVRQALGIGGTMQSARHSGSPWYDGDRSPARTITADSRTGRGFVTHEPHKLLDEPSLALRSGCHGQPGYSPRHEAGYVPVIDEPSRTLRGAGAHVPRTSRGILLGGFVPAGLDLDSPSTVEHHGGRHGSPGNKKHPGLFVPTERTDHGVLDLDEPSCATKAGGNREADGHMGGPCPPAIPNIPLDEPSPTILSGEKTNGGGGHGDPVRHRLRDTDAHVSELYEYAPTIQADPRVSKPGHHGPNEPRMALRRLTVRECATLQDFPPSFAFHGSKTAQYRAVGNAVPPGMARALGEAILAADARAKKHSA